MKLDQNIKDLLTINLDMESLYSSFIASVEKAAKEASPQKRCSIKKANQKINHPPCSLWNEECDRWVRLRKVALSRFRCTRKSEHFIEYLRQVAITRKELRRIKRESFRKFCDGLRRDTSPSYVWNIIRRFDYRWNRTETDNAYSEDKLTTINNLIEELCPP